MLLISISINVIETTAGNGFYKGYVIKSVMNSAKRNKKAVEVPKICQTKILHTFTNTTVTEEKCIVPKIYLTPTQKMLRQVFAMAIITIAIMGCLIWMRGIEKRCLIYGWVWLPQIWWIVSLTMIIAL